MDEMKPIYPLIGKKRKHPFQFHGFFYRSAMSLGSLGFEATKTMAKSCAEIGAPFNTGEWGLSVHHIPNVPFSFDKKFFAYKQLPVWTKWFYKMLPTIRMKNRFIEWCGNYFEPEKWERDLFLFDYDHWLFYTIDWDAPLEAFPQPEDLGPEYGTIILQIGSALYGMRKKTKDGSIVVDWDRFQKTSSFARGIEIKLAQWAKQTWGILKAYKNTDTIARIRGVHSGVELVSPNRFPYYHHDNEKEFFDFIEKASILSGGKPVGCKIVISDKWNIEPLAKYMATLPVEQWLDFITVDGGDGGTWAAPLALGILFGKKAYDAITIVDNILKQYGVRERLKVFASSKLYAPHQSARALALWADAVGNARSVMIAWWCIRAGLCSGEHGPCPVGIATMQRNKRRGYEQVRQQKVEHIKNYINAHNHWLMQVAAVVWVDSPSKLSPDHIMAPTQHINPEF